MPQFEVCIVESRDIRFMVEADDADEAAAIAMDLEIEESVADSFRERTLDWCQKVVD